MNLEIANRLVELRRGHNLSQEELAARLGVSRQAVSKWERAESSPDTDNLIALARLYGVSLDELLLHRAEGGGAQAAYAQAAAPEEHPADEAQQVFDAAEAWDAAEEHRAKEQRAQRRKRLLIFPYPVLVTIVFLMFGFLLGVWHPAWMLYLTIPIYYCLAAAA